MNRYLDYNKEYCWQYDVKLSTLQEDIKTYSINLSDVQLKSLKFCFVDSDNIKECIKVKKFIERYEWLGKLPVWVTHRFVAYYEDIMVAAVVLSTPNAFSDLLGVEYRNKEKLISRGATISFAPKNTASWIIMKSINWMAKNTDFVLFTAYADPSAKELGTIYQSCNFYYLGNAYGGNFIYLDSESGKCFGSSYFSQRSVIKRAAIDYGIEWKRDYIKINTSGRKRIINWNAMDNETKQATKEAVEVFKSKYKKIEVLPKHKYAYILGKTKSETSRLRKLFLGINPELSLLSYPKQRGQ